MPSAVTQAQRYITTVQGPAGGDPRTAKSVRDMGTGLASRNAWLKGQNDALFGVFQVVESVDASADELTITAHGLVNNDVVRLVAVGGSLPTPLVANLPLYVIKVDDDTIRLALVSSGSPIDLTDNGTGDLYVFRVPEALDYLMHKGFTTLKGDAIPPANLRLILAAYYMATQGGTFVGEVTRSGDAATTIDRTGALADASVTITAQTKDFWHCPDPAANRVVVLNDPPKAGLRARIARTVTGAGNSFTFNRSGGSTIGVLAAVGHLDVESYDSGDSLGVAWHGAGTATSIS